MSAIRIVGRGRARLAGPALLGLLAAGALAGAGTAMAAAGRDGAAGPAAAAGQVSTIAGGVGGPGPGTSVSVDNPMGVTFGNGHLYIAQSGMVRQLAPGTGQLTTPVGTGSFTGALGDGGPADGATLGFASAVTVDHAGNLLIADKGKFRVRVVAARTGTFYGQQMTAGHIYTIAGNGTRGYSGDGGMATSAEFNYPSGLAVDPAGNVLVTDWNNNRVRVVAVRTGTFYGQPMTAGHVYTIAGHGKRGAVGNGIPATKALLGSPTGITVDGAGNVLFANEFGSQIRVVAVKTGTFYGQSMTAGDIYAVAGTGIEGFAGDGGPATSAKLDFATDVAFDGAGNLVIGDMGNNRVRVVAESAGPFYGQPMKTGDIYTIAGSGGAGFSGDGGPATSAKFDVTQAVTVDGAGNVLIADWNNNRVRAVAVKTGTFYGQPMTAGDVYTVAGNGFTSYSGDGGPDTMAQLADPESVLVDGKGNVLTADSSNNRIRVAAAVTGMVFGRPVTAGHIYTIAGNGTMGFAGDGGPATAAELSSPDAIALDQAGNLVIDDTDNSRIRVVAAGNGTFYGQPMKTGDIYTIVENKRIFDPAGLAVDGAGNVLFAYQDNDQIFALAAKTGTFYGQPMTVGHLYVVAGNGQDGFSGDGGPATKAAMSEPDAVATDNAGNLLISDMVNERIRVVAASTGTFYGQQMTVGDIYTIAGNGKSGDEGNGGPALAARFHLPGGLLADKAGNVLIADFDSNEIRVIAARTGTFYGRQMTAGDIYAIVGTSQAGAANGPVATARLSLPDGLALDGAGNVIIADTGNGRIRKATF